MASAGDAQAANGRRLVPRSQAGGRHQPPDVPRRRLTNVGHAHAPGHVENAAGPEVQERAGVRPEASDLPRPRWSISTRPAPRPG